MFKSDKTRRATCHFIILILLLIISSVQNQHQTTTYELLVIKAVPERDYDWLIFGSNYTIRRFPGPKCEQTNKCFRIMNLLLDITFTPLLLCFYLKSVTPMFFLIPHQVGFQDLWYNRNIYCLDHRSTIYHSKYHDLFCIVGNTNLK